MLSDDNIERINDQIENLLRERTRFTTTQSRKAEIMTEINELKTLLIQQPSVEEIVAQTLQTLADSSKPRTRTEPSVTDLLVRLLDR